MASETVEQVYADVDGRVKVARSLDEDSVIHNSAVADLLANINERYMAAHKREIDAISAERDEWQKQALEENAALDVARSELAANDEEIIETNAQVENLRRLLGALLKKASPRCEKCEDVCDDCDCSYAAAVPVIKDAIAGVAIHKGDIDYMPLVKFAKNKDALEAKDAVIARLKRENFDLNGCLLAEQELAEKRNAIIKELADDLSGYICDSECNGVCASFGNCCSQTSRQIIAKAREVIK